MNEPLDDVAEPLLSPEGRVRRAAILQLAHRESRARRRRHFARRAGVAGAGLSIALAIFWLTRPQNEAPPQIVHQLPSTQRMQQPATRQIAQRPVATRSKILITRIETDSTLLQRLTLPPQKPSWSVIDDDELLRSLAEAGRPAGLAYVDGRTLILFRGTTVR